MKVIGALSVLVWILGCGGEELGAPKTKPPVENSTPKGFLLSTGLRLEGTLGNPSTPLEILKSRIYDPGPIQPIDRLAKIDERLDELNTRNLSSTRTCTKAAVQDWSPAGTLPGSLTFPMKFNCHDPLSTKSNMAFGLDGDNFYLAEQQEKDKGPEMAVFVKANKAGTKTEVLTIGGESYSGDEITDFAFMHFVADDTTKILELTVAAGGGNGLGVGCGVHLQSNETYVYAKGIFNSYGSLVTSSLTDEERDLMGLANLVEATEDCSGDTGMTQEVVVCATAADLVEVEVSLCEAAGLDTFSLTSMTYTTLQAVGVTEAKKSITTFAKEGLGDFNESDPTEESK